MTLLKELGDRVVELRRSQGISRELLAKKSGLSARFLAEVESGRGNISLERLHDLCVALDIPLATLVESLPHARRNGKVRAQDPYASVLRLLSQCNSRQLQEARLWLSGQQEQKRKIVALIGLRGAGKSTIGRKVAATLKYRFVELDELIEKAAGLTLQNIFEVHGEDYYRSLEYDVLLSFLQQKRNAVLATGGGIVARQETYDLLRRNCMTFWLQALPQDHWNRVLKQDPRPMTNYPNAMEQLQNLLHSREALYSLADFTVDTSDLGMERSKRRIVEAVRGRKIARRGEGVRAR